MWTIKNDNLVLSVSEKGAEVHSLKKVNDDYDYAWEGDKTYWAGRNPILFPQVSSNDDKTMLINGVTYKTGNHGFARNAVFELAEDKGDELVLKLSENEDTLSHVCTLYSKNHALAVEYKGFNIFAIWSQGPFVCLEPWMSWTAKDDHRELKDRDNIKILKPNEKETYKYSSIVVE